MKNRELYEENRKEIHELISSEKGLSQRKFADDYYGYVTGTNDSDPSELESHFERFKKLISPSADSRSPERISSYLRFFKEKYQKDGTHTPFDRDAAWAMFVEIDTRIATQKFNHGDIKAGLASLAALFTLNREISKQYGHRCRRYYELTNSYLNEHLRPFTSKHHQLISENKTIDHEIFKEELTKVQIQLISLRNDLLKIAT